MRPSYSMESSDATFTTMPVGLNVMSSPILISHMLNLKRGRFPFGLSLSSVGVSTIGLLSWYTTISASSIVMAMSLKISNAICGGTLKNSRFWRMRKSVSLSMVLCTNFSTSLYLRVFMVANISKGRGTAVLSSSLERTSTGRELLPIFTQSSLKLGLVRI